MSARDGGRKVADAIRTDQRPVPLSPPPPPITTSPGRRHRRAAERVCPYRRSLALGGGCGQGDRSLIPGAVPEPNSLSPSRGEGGGEKACPPVCAPWGGANSLSPCGVARWRSDGGRQKACPVVLIRSGFLLERGWSYGDARREEGMPGTGILSPVSFTRVPRTLKIISSRSAWHWTMRCRPSDVKATPSGIRPRVCREVTR
jgi:hypothetical protein